MATREKGLRGILEKLGLDKLFKKAEEVDVQKTDLGEVTGKFDETTKPGEFKKQGDIIGPEGETQTKVYSYRPESFSEMQKRTGVGEFSDDALSAKYVDSIDADVMSLDEYIMKVRGISLDDLEAERALRARKVSPEPKQVSTKELDSFSSDVQKATNRSDKDIRETIADMMNEGYEVGDPKRTTFDNDEMINAFLGVKKANQGDFEEFVDEFLKRLSERKPTEYVPPVLRDKKSFKLKAGERVFKDDDFQKSYDMADEYGFRVTDDPSDIIPYSQLSEKDIKLIKLGVPMNSKRYKAQMKGIEEGKLLSEMEDDPTKKQRIKATEDAMGISDAVKVNRAQEELKEQATKEIMEAIEEGNFRKAEAIENAFNDGTYVPGGKNRTLNAKGGRVGFATGGGTIDDRDEISFEYFGKKYIELDELEKEDFKEVLKILQQKTREFNMGGRVGFAHGGSHGANEDAAFESRLPMMPMKKPKAKTDKELEGILKLIMTGGLTTDTPMLPADEEKLTKMLADMNTPEPRTELLEGRGILNAGGSNEEAIFDQMDPNKFPGGRAEGGRIGFAEGGGGPKLNRRTFLQGLGALGASLMLPFGRGAKEAAPVVAKAIQPVAGMPSWFPLLVNRIRSKGKVTSEPGYAEFTSGGDTERIYQLEDYTLYEDMVSGKITVTGRGNEYQQVSMEYIPGENKIMTDKLGNRGVVTEKPTFEAGEYAKGDPYDYENFGDYDDMKGDLSNWENFATGGRKTDEKTVQQALEEFVEKQKNTNIIDDMANGGRVGMARGGIASKFKERVHYGN